MAVRKNRGRFVPDHSRHTGMRRSRVFDKLQVEEIQKISAEEFEKNVEKTVLYNDLKETNLSHMNFSIISQSTDQTSRPLNRLGTRLAISLIGIGIPLTLMTISSYYKNNNMFLASTASMIIIGFPSFCASILLREDLPNKRERKPSELRLG